MPGPPATTTQDGKFAGAGVFDGNGRITVPDAPSLHPTTELTLAAWVYPTALPDPAPRRRWWGATRWWASMRCPPWRPSTATS